MTTKQRLLGSRLALLGVLAFTVFGFTRPKPGHNLPDDNAYFKPAYIKDILVKAATWQLNHPKHATTDWTNGAFYSGVFAAYQTTRSALLMDSLMAMGERTGWQPGRRYDHADDIAICQTYLNLYRIKKDRRMIQPTIDTVQKLRTTPGQEVQKNGITWWWCDALFMAPPVLTGLGRTLNEPWYYKLNDSLFRQTYDRLYNTQEHLFARDGSYLVNADGTGK